MPGPTDFNSLTAINLSNKTSSLADDQQQNALLSIPRRWLRYQVSQPFPGTSQMEPKISQNGESLNSSIRSVALLPGSSYQLISDHQPFPGEALPSPPTALEILSNVCFSVTKLNNDISKHTQSSTDNMAALNDLEKPDANAYSNSASYDARERMRSGATDSSKGSRHSPEFLLRDHNYAQKKLKYEVLLKQAITSHPGKKATLKQIYQWLKANYGADPKLSHPHWQNSVRHALSFSEIFLNKKEMDGKANKRYWTIASFSKSVPPGIQSKPDRQPKKKTGHSTNH